MTGKPPESDFVPSLDALASAGGRWLWKSPSARRPAGAPAAGRWPCCCVIPALAIAIIALGWVFGQPWKLPLGPGRRPLPAPLPALPRLSFLPSLAEATGPARRPGRLRRDAGPEGPPADRRRVSHRAASHPVHGSRDRGRRTRRGNGGPGTRPIGTGETVGRTPPLGDDPGAGRRSARDRGVPARCLPDRSRAGTVRRADTRVGRQAAVAARHAIRPAPAPRAVDPPRAEGGKPEERLRKGTKGEPAPAKISENPSSRAGRARQDLAGDTPKAARPRRRRPRAAPANPGACREARRRRASRKSQQRNQEEGRQARGGKARRERTQEGRGSIRRHGRARQFRRLQPQPRLHRLGEQGPHRSRRQRGIRTGGGCRRRRLGVRSARRTATEPARPPPAGEPRPEHRIRKHGQRGLQRTGRPGRSQEVPRRRRPGPRGADSGPRQGPAEPRPGQGHPGTGPAAGRGHARRRRRGPRPPQLAGGPPFRTHARQRPCARSSAHIFSRPGLRKSPRPPEPNHPPNKRSSQP